MCFTGLLNCGVSPPPVSFLQKEEDCYDRVYSLQNFDYVAIFVYIELMSVIGFAFGWFVKDSSSFFKGGGAIPWVMATITNYMGLFSTFVFVAYAGIAYGYGFAATMSSLNAEYNIMAGMIMVFGAFGIRNFGGRRFSLAFRSLMW